MTGKSEHTQKKLIIILLNLIWDEAVEIFSAFKSDNRICKECDTNIVFVESYVYIFFLVTRQKTDLINISIFIIFWASSH